MSGLTNVLPIAILIPKKSFLRNRSARSGCPLESTPALAGQFLHSQNNVLNFEYEIAKAKFGVKHRSEHEWNAKDHLSQSISIQNQL